jgi:thymidylate synthase
MRFYKNCTELMNETAREVFSRGQASNDRTRQGKIHTETANEIIGYNYKLISPQEDELDNLFSVAREITGKEFIKKEIADKWFEEMFIDINPHTHWSMHPELVEYFKRYCAELDGCESYTYGNRLSENYKTLIDKLLENPERRGAMLTVYNSDKDLKRCGQRRIPCSSSYQPLIRRTFWGEYFVNLIYTERSCDFVWFFTFDVYRAIRLMQKIAADLNERGFRCQSGDMIHFITSLHAYKSEIPDRYQW